MPIMKLLINSAGTVLGILIWHVFCTDDRRWSWEALGLLIGYEVILLRCLCG